MAAIGSLLFIAECHSAELKIEPFSSSAAAKDVQFTRLDDAETGIDFVSPLLPEHPFAYLYHSGMTCSGIATGDVDGDGRPDLFLANGPSTNKLYLQRDGDGIQFEDVTAVAGPGLDGGEKWAAGVAMADVDNDGDLDIYVCNYEAPNQLFINVGPGDGQRVRFKEVAGPAGVDVVDASHVAAFCDYDNDGDLDFYLLTNRVEDPKGALSELPVDFDRPGVPTLREGYERYYGLWVVDADNWGVESLGRPDLLFRNDGVDAGGQVHFTKVSKQSGISGRGDGLSCTWWDADLDGDTDLYVCDDFVSPDRFYINNGDGTFTNKIAEAVPHTTWFSMGSDFGDLDNDGDFDLLVADMSATSHYKSKVTMGIMGGMALRRANESNPPQYMRNALFVNEGANQFREAAYMAGLSSSDWTWSVKMNDYDADGLTDVFLTNGVPREMNHSDIKITSDMLKGKHMWEFFKDGEMRKEQNRVYRNLGNLKFEDASQKWGLDHKGASYGAVSADFDLDGDLDLAVMNLEENVAIYRNDGSVGAQLIVQLQGATANRLGVGAIVKVEVGDQKWIRQLMPGTGYHSYDQPILHFGLGDAKRIDKITVSWPGGAKQSFANVAVDRRVTIKQTGQSQTDDSSGIKEEKPWFEAAFELEDLWHQDNVFDDFALQPLLPHRLSAEGPCMASADVNGDGNIDIFVGGAAGSPGELRMGSGGGRFALSSASNASVFLADAAAEDASALFGDLDGDGDVDLLIGSGSYEFAEGDAAQTNRLYLNDGKGTFTRAPTASLPATATNTGTLAACDFDHDGDLDVFVGTRVKHGAYPLSTESALWKNEDGKLVDTAESVAEGLAELGMVTAAVWSDVDGDNWEDLLVAREWGDIVLFANEKGKLVRRDAGAMTGTTGWWTDLVAGDVDGDGDVDLVAANVGLNTKYKTSAKKPMTLYYGEFDASGERHIVEVKQEGNVCYPERGRSCSSNAMPFIADKFSTFHDFGLATLSDIYGEDKLGSASRFEAKTFEHGVFLNDGAGRFDFRPLPRITQIAPSRAIALADLDGDEDLDLIVGQNFFGPQSETGRYDGGLGQILENDGQGNFAPIRPVKSGFIVRQAATGLMVGDVNADGSRDIIVVVNDGPVQTFLNQKR